jgi:hypothetical protein
MQWTDHNNCSCGGTFDVIGMGACDPKVAVPSSGEFLVRDGRVIDLLEVDVDPNPEGWTYTCYAGPED